MINEIPDTLTISSDDIKLAIDYYPEAKEIEMEIKDYRDKYYKYVGGNWMSIVLNKEQITQLRDHLNKLIDNM